MSNKRTRVMEEEEKTTPDDAAGVALTQEQQRLAALEVELANAKAEEEKWSGLVSLAILEDAPKEKKEEYKGERSHWERKVDKLERQIAELKRESLGKLNFLGKNQPFS